MKVTIIAKKKTKQTIAWYLHQPFSQTLITLLRDGNCSFIHISYNKYFFLNTIPTVAENIMLKYVAKIFSRQNYLYQVTLLKLVKIKI